MTDDARAARAELERLLEADAPALRAELPPGFADVAEQFVRLLLEANTRLNLTRVVTPDDIARLHLLDAVAAAPLLPSDARRAVDLGSGGGVPGIVLAMARPEMHWTLVDSLGKKVDALRSVATGLGLANVDVIASRAELLGRGPQRESFDLVTARALASLPVLAEYALPMLRVGGTLLAWKGPITDDELAAGGTASELLGGGAPEERAAGIPALGDHRFILIEKLRPTPARWPRRPGDPARRPLG
jgi:16S rRNA (guanine527-N7)-methyltransferase